MRLLYHLLLIPFFSFILGSTAYSQKERSFSVSYNKHYAWKFKSNNGGYIKHYWGLEKGWYLTGGVGFWIWEHINFSINHDPDLLITILPEYEFALKDVVSATDGRVGFSQRRPRRFVDLHVPVFVTFGRSWLQRSKRFSLDTDVGLLVSYFHKDGYGWTDFIAIESGLNVPEPKFVNEYGDPAFWLQGKSVDRKIEHGLSMNLESTYYLNEHLGFGINIFMGWYVVYSGGYSTYGLHLKYRY